MAKGGKKNDRSGDGSNVLTDDQRQALFLQNMQKLRRAKEEMATANSNLRNCYKVAKSDGFPKKDFDFAFDLEKDKDDGVMNERRREIEIAQWVNHPLGVQADLFESARDGRSMKEKAFDAGKIDGMNGKPCKSPYDDPETSNAFVEGHQAGQAAIFKISKKNPDEDTGLVSDKPERGADEFDSDADGDGSESAWPDDAAVAANAAAKTGDGSDQNQTQETETV